MPSLVGAIANAGVSILDGIYRWDIVTMRALNSTQVLGNVVRPNRLAETNLRREENSLWGGDWVCWIDHATEHTFFQQLKFLSTVDISILVAAILLNIVWLTSNTSCLVNDLLRVDGESILEA